MHKTKRKNNSLSYLYNTSFQINSTSKKKEYTIQTTDTEKKEIDTEHSIEKKMENMENFTKEIQLSLDQAIKTMKMECMDEIAAQNKKQMTNIEQMLSKQAVDMHNEILSNIDKRLTTIHVPNTTIGNNVDTVPNTTIGNTKELRSGRKIATTGTNFADINNTDESSEEDEEDEDDEEEKRSKDFEKSLDAWVSESDAQGLHITLHQVIISLRSKEYLNHEELDEIIVELHDVASLEYPTRDNTEDISLRQAKILKLITCFYQAICVVSSTSGVPCEHVYGKEELLQQAIDTVQGIH